jgi:hypothetical protein
MGAFSSRPDILIENKPGWDKGEYIKIKGVMTAGDSEQIARAQVSQSNPGEMMVNTSQLAMLECMITDWLLLGDGGSQVPLYIGEDRRKNRKAIARLPMEYMLPVLEAVDALSKRDTVADPDDFFAGASAPSKAH